MSTVSRWRPAPSVRLPLWLLGLEVFLVALMIFVAGASELPSAVWFVLVAVSIVAHSVLFYNVGRVRERLRR